MVPWSVSTVPEYKKPFSHLKTMYNYITGNVSNGMWQGGPDEQWNV